MKQSPRRPRNDKVNTRIAQFVEKLSPMGITQNDLFVDFITQNRV
jgi:hypothetical protein